MKKSFLVPLVIAVFSAACSTTVVEPQLDQRIERVVIRAAAESYGGYMNRTISSSVGLAGLPVDQAASRTRSPEIDRLYESKINKLDLRKNLIESVRIHIAQRYPGAQIEVSPDEVTEYRNFESWWRAEAGSKTNPTRPATLYAEIGYINFIVTDLRGTRADGALAIKFIDGRTNSIIGKTTGGPGVVDERTLIGNTLEPNVGGRVTEHGMEKFKELHKILVQQAFAKLGR